MSVRDDRDGGRPRMPTSTYRVQFHRGFTFEDGRRLVPYLATLGVTDVYASPYLTARPGSTHGYDICDHNQLNPEIGDERDHAAFFSTLEAHGLGQIVDFVPNHMGIDPATNAWWRDVLENGPSSTFAHFFDIDWHPVTPELRGKVLLPILGDHYGAVLERGELRLQLETGALELRYFEHRLPINPRQAPRVFEHDLATLQQELGGDDPRLRELLSIITALRRLPSYTERDPARIVERHREKDVARERLARLVESTPRIRAHIERAVRVFNGVPERPSTFDLLHALLEAQAYRLAHWRTAAEEINYRRFFDINDLAGLRMEDRAVFDWTHALVLRLVREGKVAGFRIDHPDGLLDPAAYFDRFQNACRIALEGQATSASSDDSDGEGERRRSRRPAAPRAVTRAIYMVVEKILSADESLPGHWSVHGTTGYNFLNDVNGLFVDTAHAVRMRRIYERFTGRRDSFDEVVYQCKKIIMLTAMASELNVLAAALKRISEGSRHSRDFTLYSLRKALTEVIACFPVYRTYVTGGTIAESDRRVVATAIAQAQRRDPLLASSVFRFLHEALLPAFPTVAADAQQQERLHFAMKFQQYTGPVQAKGVEDTAFYRYNVLLSLNEVGGDPRRFGRSLTEFHEANRLRLERWPYEMIGTATHDTKRGEDARMRLDVLSEIPEEWRVALSRWARVNGSARTRVDGVPSPDRNDEYLFYQALLGAWPAEPAELQLPRRAPLELAERLVGYMRKATKEAKTHTSWINDHQAYDQAVAQFVERVLTGPNAERFLLAFVPLARRIARLGAVNSLSQVVLKLVAPGAPDVYQGTELWDLSLVDPDNRRPVDYTLRQRLLDDLTPYMVGVEGRLAGRAKTDVLETETMRALLSDWPDGRIKLLVTALGLRFRRRCPELLLTGAYLPLAGEGDRAAHVVCFARCHAAECALAIVPRLVAGLGLTEESWPLGTPTWGSTEIALPEDLPSSWHNLFTGETVRTTIVAGRRAIRVAEALRSCPVALLYSR